MWYFKLELVQIKNSPLPASFYFESRLLEIPYSLLGYPKFRSSLPARLGPPRGLLVSFPDPPLRDGTRCEAEGLEDLARIIAEIVRIVSRDWDYNYLISVSNILNHGFF